MKIEKLRLKKLINTRDLGGLPTSDGRKIKKGKLIRSGRLYKLPLSAQAALKSLGLKTVIDLRTGKEREEYPIHIIDGVDYVHLPLVCTATVGITHEKSMASVVMKESKRIEKEFASADEYMNSMYEIILFEKGSVSRLRKIFDILLDSDGCVLWQCNAGKDRTGIVSMLIESALGVDRQTVIADYTMSDYFQRTKRSFQRLGLRLFPLPPRFRKMLFALMRAKREYIEGAISLIEERCGSIEGYLKDVLLLSDGDMVRLKSKYLE